MAKPYLKRKLKTYRALYHINRDFTVLIQHIWELQHGGFVGLDNPETFREYARELQAQINHDVTSVMQPIEAQEWFAHGKHRIEREHVLNPDRPAFFEKPPEPPKDAPKKPEK